MSYIFFFLLHFAVSFNDPILSSTVCTDPNCIKCKADQITCEECSSSSTQYLLQQGKCLALPCEEYGCSECGLSGCLSCSSGFAPSGSGCYALCGPYCLSCPFGDYCYYCVPGYYKDYDGACEKCSDGCALCDDKYYCQRCESGYHLIKDTRECEKTGVLEVWMIVVIVASCCALIWIICMY